MVACVKERKWRLVGSILGFLLASPGARLVGEQRVDSTWIIFLIFSEEK